MDVALPWEIIHRDSLDYIKLASNLCEHHSFGFDAGQPSARRELLYPLFLALFMKLGLVTPFETSAQNFWPVLAVQAALYLAALSMLASWARRRYDAPVPAFTVLFGAAYFPLSQYAFQILSELPSLVLIAGFFRLLDSREDNQEVRRLWGSGLLLGLLGVLKSVVIPAGPLVAGFLLLTRRASPRLLVGFVLISLAFPIAWTARNHQQLGELIVSTTDGASSLYRGNMMLGYQPPGWSDPKIPEEVRRQRSSISPGEANQYLLRLTKERLRSAPGEYGLHLLYKLMVLWVGQPGSAAETVVFLLRLLLFVVASSQLASTIRRGDPMDWLMLLFCLYLSLLYTLIFTTPRYFAPAAFLLLPLCVARGWRPRQTKAGPAS